MADVRVLEVASWIFVPAAGAVLADWGADVIKVEHPVFGDPQRGLLTMSITGTAAPPPVNFMTELPNRGKRSVGLDLATDAGRELLYRIAETSDVFLTNFLPDTRQRLQIDVEHLRACNPNIIYARGTGQGSRGPDAKRGAYDGSAYWARGGIAHAITPLGQEWPIAPLPAFGDLTGAMTIAGGIAAALFRRERIGTASVVDVSLLGCSMWQLSPDVVGSQLTDVSLASTLLNRDEPPNALFNQYRTSDERVIQLVMPESDRYWAELCWCVGRPELADDPRFSDWKARFENRRACVAALDEAFSSRTLAEWRKALDATKAVWGAYQTPSELHDDPQAIANGYVQELKTGTGTPFTLVSSPVQFDECPVGLSCAPEHGQHTEEVLLELGLTWEEIGRHKESGAIL
jgi:crotonobetainyl-CoA:carnitine CoA-transferase CaiB-like acyl-CoA transferase